jgi:hypothetical protein
VYLRYRKTEYAWCEPELFAALGSGYRVAVRFDPSEPTLGAAIFNREEGSKNKWGFAPGQYLGLADFHPDAPQIAAAKAFANDGMKKRFNDYVRTEYREIGDFGVRAARGSEVRDGRGAVQRVDVGTPKRNDERGPRKAAVDVPGVNRIAAAERKRADGWKRNYDERLAAARAAEEELMPLSMR